MVTFPTGVVHVRDDDDVLDAFSSFLVGFATRGTTVPEMTHKRYREVCRSLGAREKENPGYLSFSSPEIMVTFGKQSVNLSLLMARVPVVGRRGTMIKNREARTRQPAEIFRPKTIL